MSTLHPMNRENKPWYGQSRFWWLIIILLAGLVYFMGIAHESIWFDERGRRRWLWLFLVD